MVMDARRFDRNADQLSQIFWHFTKLQKQQMPNKDEKIELMLAWLQSCLKLNDKIAEDSEKGLI